MTASIFNRFRTVCLIVAVLGLALIFTGEPNAGGTVLFVAVASMLAVRVALWVVRPR